MNSIGFDLEDSFFYVHGCNVGNIAQFGSTLTPSTIGLYTANDSNLAYHWGVEGSNDPVFWIGKQLGMDPILHMPIVAPNFFIRGDTGNIGIGTDQPKYSLDVHGDIHITGQLFQKQSNVIILSELVQATVNQTDFLTSSNADGIDFTDTRIYNVESAQVNDTIYTSNIVVYGSGNPRSLTITQTGNVGIGTSIATSTLSVVGRFETAHNVQVHVMGDMQNVRAMQASSSISSQDVQELYMIVEWTEDMNAIYDVALSFFASGQDGLRMHVKSSHLVNAQSGSEDVLTDKSSFQSQNISLLTPFIRPHAAQSVEIGVRWQASTLATHTAHLRLDMTAPLSLGPMNVLINAL